MTPGRDAGHDAMMREALSRIEELQARLRDADGPRHEPVAIVGMGCRFPGAAGTEAYWRLLSEGVDAVAEIPRSRWDVDAYYDPNPDAAGRMYTRHGGFLDGIEDFDAGFFGISPREAVSLDPQQRLLLEICWEALEEAGIAADTLAGSASGVFMGIGGVDYYQRLAARDPRAIDAYMASGNAHSIASGRLSYLLGLQGPCLSVDTACSSSLVAVHLACRSLRDRECDLALAGGVSVILSPAIHLNHCRSRMLAPDGRCKAFDAAADGFIRSEGCGVVVLKRVADAERDGDRILAVIRGSAVNQDGRTSALTVPNGPAQQAVIRRAQADARVAPDLIAFVEAHGTGTALGDPIEAAALGAVFGSRAEPVCLGSVKANIGHAEAAAGVAGLIKVVLAMQHRELPPQLHFHEPNPRIEWSRLPLRVATTREPWGAPDASVFAGVSSFGFGGTNAHLVIEGRAGAGADATEADLPPGGGLLLLSAKTTSALRSQAARYRHALASPRSAPPVAAVCATAATGRVHMPVRAAVAADSAAEMRAALDAVAAGRAPAGVWQGEAHADLDGRIAFVYPGQGALRWGLGRELYETHAVYRDAIDRCGEALRAALPLSLVDVLYAQRGQELVGRTEYAQPALFATEHALTALWASLGVHPDMVIGHSVGEFAAACAAGVLGVEDACRLVAARGRVMQPLGGCMAVVVAPEARVRELLAAHPRVVIAAINGPEQIVISGERDSMRAVLAEVGRAGWNGRELGDVAFHSPVMEPALPAWRDEVARMRFGAPQCEWVSTVTGRDVAAEMDDPEYWVTHVRQPVRYMAGAQRVWEMGARVWIEIGPTAGLTTLAAEGAGDASSDGVWVAGMRPGRPERDTVRRQIAQAYVAGVRVDWRGWDPVRRARVALPTYPFERTRYWIDAPVRAESAPAVAEWPDAYACEVRWEACEPAPGPARVPTQGGAAWVVCGGRPETVAGASAWLTAHGVAVLPAIVPGSDVAGVVHVGGLDCPAFDGADAARLQESAVVAGCLSVAAVLRAGAASATGARLWVATRGAVAVSGSDREVAPAQAPFWGFGKVAALEYPDAWGGLIDLDPEVDGFAGLERVLIEVGEDQLAVRDGRFLAPRLRQTRLGRRSVSLGADATFLITGGLGALGLEVAERLVASGARHLVLVGRRPPGKAAGARLERFRARGVTLYAERADVTSSHDMRRVFAHMAADMPPLRGVVHAAGANGHHPIADLDAHAMGNVVAAKMSGAWVLHALTRDLPLDFFVCFSSIASVWGSKGQAHYAAANAFLDALVSYRIRRNLPASAINWGPWAAGGMATEEAQSWLGRVGVQPLAPAVALDAFEACLASSGHTVIANVDWPRFLEVYQSRRVSPFFSDMTADMSARAPMPEDTGLADTIRAKGPVEGRRALQHFVREHVVQVLNLDPEHAPAPHQGFFSIGFDSLMALELKDRLAGALHVPLPSTLAFDYANSRDLVEYLAREVLRLDAAETVPDARAVELAGLAGADLPADVRASVDATLKRFDKLMGGR